MPCMWYVAPFSVRPKSPVINWLGGIIWDRTDKILRHLNTSFCDVSEGRTEFVDEVKRLLVGCRYAAALCGLKTGLVDDPGAYYKLFYDHAVAVAESDELRVIRCFVKPQDSDDAEEQERYAKAHMNEPNVQPLRMKSKTDRADLEKQLPGLKKQLSKRRFGFVVFAYENHVKVIVHQLKGRRFRFGGWRVVCQFWISDDVSVVEAFVRIFKDIAERSEEYRNHSCKASPTDFLEQIDIALAKMPLRKLTARSTHRP